MKFKIVICFILIAIAISGCNKIVNPNSSLSNSTRNDSMIEVNTSLVLSSVSSKLANKDTTKRGNTIGNLISGWDYAVSSDGLLYSVLFDFDSSNYALYSSNIDGSNENKIYIGEIHILNILYGWIYFSNSGKNGTLCKIKTDGSNIAQISDDENVSQVTLVDDWIYYGINYKQVLYKIKIDGTNKTKLCDFEPAYMNIDDDWIYFSDANAGLELYKIRTDGSDLIKLNDEPTHYTNVYKDWIYYKSNNGFIKIKLDGTEKTKLSDNDMRNINVNNDLIYYIDFTNNSDLYKMKLDGTGAIKITDGKVSSFSIIGDWIRFTIHIPEDWETYQIKKDGTEKKLIRPGIDSK